MSVRIPLLLIALSICGFSVAQSFDFNENCKRAYHTILSLKLKNANTLLQAEEKLNPDNLIPVYLENYIDFLNLYAGDQYVLYDQIKKNKEVRLAQLMEGNKDSPYYLFTQAEVNIQWAAIEIKFGEFLNAIWGIRKAYRLLVENQKIFPDFKPNKKTLGVLYALLGSVPDKYKWGISLLGMEGNLDKGNLYLRELTTKAASAQGKENVNDFIFQAETITCYAFILFHLENQSEKAWQLLMQWGFPGKDNLMNVYTCAHIGVYGKHNEEVLKVLSERPSDSSYMKLPALNYLTGLARLNKLEPNSDTCFKQFIVSYRGENHVKSSFQKIAWCYLLKGDTLNYFHFIKKTLHIGASHTDADRQAEKEGKSNRVPNIILLRARLLTDGGYFQRAANEMNRVTENTFTSAEEKTEFLYRWAKIYDESDKQDSALLFYLRTIGTGKDLPRHFAANASFETGKIYEAKGDREKAKYYYQLCMRFENHEYKNSLDQKAQVALNRLK